VDWLIDTSDADSGSAKALALLDEHLRAHAADERDVTEAVKGLPSQLAAAIRSAAGRPAHMRLDWVSEHPVLDLSAVDGLDGLDGLDDLDDVTTDAPVPARHRAALRERPHEQLASVTLHVVRPSQLTFDSGPPPVIDTALDPEEQGPATVALALVTALEAHPAASAPQAATIAGALIATAGAPDDITDAAAVGEAFVRLHRAIGSEAYVVATDDEVVELAVTKCPFGRGDRPTSALCHVSTGLAGQLAAKVKGSATVVLDEAIVAGDAECHLQVLLRDGAGKDEGDSAQAAQPFYWPPRAAAAAEAVPHLDLSVALPRESVSVPVVRRLAAQALRAFGVLDEDIDDVQLAITEACANVIDHAGATDTYDVKIELSADRCAITVVDQGGGFDVDQVPEKADDDAEMGRGVALMRALVDNVAFRNEPQAGAVVHMVKALRYVDDHPLRRR
jgi:serine/threonine-protein kinase RsbW